MIAKNWTVFYRAKHLVWGRTENGSETVSADSPLDAARQVKSDLLDRIQKCDPVEALVIEVNCYAVLPIISPVATDVDEEPATDRPPRLKVSFWCGGFGFGVWRSVWPSGPIWSVAIGPVTVYIGRR